MKKYDQIVLSREAWGDELYNVLGQTLKILLREGYECQIYDDDLDILVIKFNYSKRMGFGDPELMWLEEDEVDLINDYRAGELEALDEVN